MKMFEILLGAVFVLVFTQPSQACSRPRKCNENDYTSSLSPGKVPLYSDISDGNHNYIIVINDNEDTGKMMTKIGEIKSPSNKRVLPKASLNGPSNGIKAVISDLDDEQLDMVRQMDGVKYVEKNVLVVTDNTNVWGLDRIDQTNLPLDGIYSPSEVIVYVIDSGVNTHHVNFGGRAENWHEVVTDNSEDCTGHGTHVAGTISARTYGVAQGVKIRSVRVIGCSGSTVSNVIEGINYILTNGVSGSIVSMSLSSNKSYSMDNAVKSLIQAGFVVVVAAGNQNQDACERSPARVNQAITVGATNTSDHRASFSNYGDGVDIFAPGVGIRSLSHNSNYGTTYKSGTSMSTPHVSGVAALLRCRGIPAAEIRQKIIDLSTKNVVLDPNGSHNRMLYID